MRKVKDEIFYGIYGIYHKNKLLYIGSTNDFIRRKKEHIIKLLDGSHQKNLQKYVNTYVTNIEDLEFKLIHKTLDNSKIRLFFAEMICIFIYKPCCNRAVYQVGLKYINLGNPVICFDNEILKYL